MPWEKQCILCRGSQKGDERKSGIESLSKEAIVITTLTWGKKQISKSRKSAKYQTK